MRLAMTVQDTSGKTLTAFGAAIEADERGRIELAHLIGVDPVTLWRWMTGRSRPQSEGAKRQAAEVLGRPVTDLFPEVHGAEVSALPAPAHAPVGDDLKDAA